MKIKPWKINNNKNSWSVNVWCFVCKIACACAWVLYYLFLLFYENYDIYNTLCLFRGMGIMRYVSWKKCITSIDHIILKHIFRKFRKEDPKITHHSLQKDTIFEYEYIVTDMHHICELKRSIYHVKIVHLFAFCISI